MTDYSMLPQHMQDGARLYVEQGIAPGHFMTAVLANDFLRAAGRADEENLRSLPLWARWIYNEIPIAAHGSYEAVEKWCEHGGLSRLADQNSESAA